MIGRAGDSIKISNSAVKGEIKAIGQTSVGGLVGHYFGTITISNSYVVATIEGFHETGGLVGTIMAKGKISNSYVTGVFTAVSTIPTNGGLIGEFVDYSNNDYIVANSYFDKSGVNSAPTFIGDNYDANILIVTGIIGVDGASDIVEKDSKFYVKSTGTDDDLNDDDEQIFVDWDANIWQIVVGHGQHLNHSLRFRHSIFLHIYFKYLELIFSWSERL